MCRSLQCLPRPLASRRCSRRLPSSLALVSPDAAAPLPLTPSVAAPSARFAALRRVCLPRRSAPHPRRRRAAPAHSLSSYSSDVGQFTPRRGPLIAAVLVGAGAAAVTGLLQGLAWLVEQGLILTDLPRPAWLGPLAGWVNALVVAVPSLVLARWVPTAGRVWALGALALGVLSTARAVPLQHNTG